ncbi:MAG: hypothetical protein QF926_11925 [Alphaproteobacteria bacterium]|jgi:hypothetical protein|nr:hypothetical protein [Alphaproteobacteria bacterium]MDP6517313.1 hypothetical protein [Alphaproteobacteria bacterium]
MNESGHRRLELVLAIGLMAVALAIYGWRALTSPVLDSERFAQRAFLRAFLDQNAPDPELEAALAEAYWRRYPEIRDHPHYGPGGVGVPGARAHYLRRGRYLDYRWGLD